MTATSILVAEDDPHIREGLVETLESERYSIAAADNGEEALRLARKQAYDLIILDVMMPRMSGYDVCREIRKADVHTPIILLTAKGEEIDKVVGLRLGADDYITKPFGIHELLARIEAALRRSRLPGARRDADRSAFQFGPARIEPSRFHVQVGDKHNRLSARELTLLRLFAAHPGEVLTREKLLEIGWGQQYLGTSRTLDQHIVQLRKKIESDPAEPKTIVTVHGIGYRYDA